MGKKEFNHKLLKAIAIGISATMAFQPVAVIAEENVDANIASQEVVTETPVAVETPSSTVSDVDAANSEYVGQVGTADTAVADVADDVQAVQGVQDKVDAAEDYANAGSTENQKDLPNASEIAETYENLVTAENQVDTDKTNVNGDVENIKNKGGAADTAVGNLQEAVGEVETMANGVKGAVDAAEAAITDAEQGIKDAGNDEEAKAAYQVADDAVAAANMALAQAEENYEAKKNAYEEALAIAEQAEAEFKDAIATAGSDVTTAVANMETAKARATELKQQAEDAFKALKDAQAEIDLAGLEAAAQAAAGAQELADNAAGEAEGLYNDAVSEKEGTEAAVNTAQNTANGLNPFNYLDKYAAAVYLKDIAQVNSNANASHNQDSEKLTEQLLKTEYYAEILYNIYPQYANTYSSLSFSEWNDGSIGDNEVRYVKVTYRQKGHASDTVKYFTYNRENKDTVIYELKVDSVGEDGKIAFKDVPTPPAYSYFAYQLQRHDLHQNSNDYLKDHKYLKSAYENFASALDNVTNAVAQDNLAAQKVDDAKAEWDRLQGLADQAAAATLAAQGEYNNAVTANGNLNDAKAAYESLAEAAKKADDEVGTAAEKLAALQNAIKGLSKQMLIGDELIDVNIFTIKIAELKKAFEDAKEIYDDAVAKKTNIDNLMDKLTEQLNDKLVADDQGTTGGGTTGGTSPGGTTGGGAPADVAGAGTADDAGAAVAAVAGTAQNAAVIADDQVAMAATTGQGGAPAGQVLGATRQYNQPAVKKTEASAKKVDKSKKTNDKVATDNTKKTANIEEDDVALAASIPEVTETAKNFWWLALLILVALAVTIEETIRRMYKNENTNNEIK